jgi:ABC-type phosphate/phosphonate transport system substrate-binding protein
MFHSNLYTGKTKAPKDIAIQTTARVFLIFLSFIFMITSGCVKKETPKKVSLKKKSVEKVGEVDYPLQDTLWFGFDLRLDPKEDFRTYIPLLKYLEGATDRRFRIKFSEKYEDTVEDLGKGVTHFAFVGTLGYIIGEAKYGIKYLVSGVKPGVSELYPSIIIAYNRSVDSRTVETVRAALLAFEPLGKHKNILNDWDKTEMPMGFTKINELELEKVKALARNYGLIENVRAGFKPAPTK